MLHVRTLQDAFFADILMHLKKINTPIYIVFQIDKNITILTIQVHLLGCPYK